jgi:hypothetical protein
VNYLFIELSENAVRFTSILGESTEKKMFSFKDKIDYKYKEQLDSFFNEAGLKNLDFDEYSISWSGKRSSLIPTNIFAESNAKALFNLCFGSNVAAGDIDYNRIPEQGIVNVFDIPIWVKSFFVIRFPRSVIQHESSHFIRALFMSPSFKLRCALLVYDDFFQLAIVKENNVQFFSLFEYLETDDIIYNFMFTLQQKKYVSSMEQIDMYAGVGCSDLVISELTTKIQSLADLKNVPLFVNTDTITKSQLQCV